MNSGRHIKEGEYKKPETFLSESINIIRNVFEIFTDGRENLSPPRNDRLLWLATTGMILRFNKLRSKISVAEHIEIIEQHEEYWRFQFFKLIDENETNFIKSYFNPSGKPYAGDCIARN